MERFQKLAPVRVVMEATEGLEVKSCTALAQAALPVCVVNPRQVRVFAQATGTRCKTDRVDAHRTARFAQAL